jgi:ubiquinone/menaquinone biosynthesis C-methylase UbiE
MVDRKAWADKQIHQFDPDFSHRWEVYDETLKQLLTDCSVWLDCGCGNNALVHEFAPMAKSSYGIDVFDPPTHDNLYIKADLKQLPFGDSTVDLVSLRFVVEHIPDVERDLRDIVRVLKPGGKLLVLTTNIKSPFVALGRIFPDKLKRKLISLIFREKDEDIFETYHNFNTPERFQQGISKLHPIKIQFISDLNYIRKPVFYIYLLWHIITIKLNLTSYRTNILGIFEKT